MFRSFVLPTNEILALILAFNIFQKIYLSPPFGSKKLFYKSTSLTLWNCGFIKFFDEEVIFLSLSLQFSAEQFFLLLKNISVPKSYIFPSCFCVVAWSFRINYFSKEEIFKIEYKWGAPLVLKNWMTGAGNFKPNDKRFHHTLQLMQLSSKFCNTKRLSMLSLNVLP